jgi:beta-carotene 3-hydroxylase
MWCFHAGHQQTKNANIFERNDIFFVIFAASSIALISYG